MAKVFLVITFMVLFCSKGFSEERMVVGNPVIYLNRSQITLTPANQFLIEKYTLPARVPKRSFS